MAEARDALVVIDMLNDFVLPGAPLEVPKAREIIKPIAQRIESARSQGKPVIFVCDAHDPDDAEFRMWPPHAIKSTNGAQVIDELKPQHGDLVIEKKTYSGFYGTDLETVLRARGIKRLTIVGILTNVCVLFTAADAVMRGFEVGVPKECVASTGEQEHDFALKEMQKVLKVSLS